MNNDHIERIATLNRDHTFFHWIKQKDANPIHVSHAQGVYFWDQNDKQYLDFSAQLVNVNVGHGNKKIIEAVTKQMGQISHAHAGQMTTEARGLLGKKLSDIAPGDLDKTLFTLCGSTSNETAIMLARFVTGKHKIITKYRSYHGCTNGAAALSGDPRRLTFDQNTLVGGIVRVEDPYVYRCPWGQTTAQDTCKKALAHVEDVINFEGPDTIAAIFMEGESGTSGCIKYPEGYLKGIRQLADKYNILFIADEVMSGFGRCGEWFAVQNADVVPDMITTAKGLTSGYVPLGAVIMNKRIADYLEDHAFTFGMTYGAHPVACAAGVANLQVIEEEGLIENCRQVGAYTAKCLEELKQVNPSIGDVRITGLLGVIEVVKNRETKEPMAPWNAQPEDMKIMGQVFAKLRELGLFTFARWNHIFVGPPLIATNAHIDEGLEKISQALKIADQYVE